MPFLLISMLILSTFKIHIPQRTSNVLHKLYEHILYGEKNDTQINTYSFILLFNYYYINHLHEERFVCPHITHGNLAWMVNNFEVNKMKNTTLGTFQNPIGKTYERSKIDSNKTQYMSTQFSWHRAGTSIKSGGIKLVSFMGMKQWCCSNNTHNQIQIQYIFIY